MKAFLRRLFGKSKIKKEAPVTPPKKAEPKPRKRTDSSFEPLEGRIAPALLLNPSTIQFKDVDGDLVTVTFSKSIFTQTGTPLNAKLDQVFQFKDPAQHVRLAADGGSATDVGELALIDLTALGTVNPSFKSNLTITATPQGGMGNDLVNIGYIKSATSSASGNALGNVIVDGDLGRIDAGDPSVAIGLASLTVQSMGAVGVTSQLASGTLKSTITGGLGKLVVKGDFVDEVFKVANGLPKTAPGNLGSVTIGGKLQVSAGTVTTDIAQITADGNIGPVHVGTTAADGIFGGTGANTALIKAGGKIGTVTIIGDLRGGAGKDSGEINGATSIGNVSISGDLWAGAGENSGRIVSAGGIGAVTLGTLHGDTTFGSNGAGVAGKNAATIVAGGALTSLTTRGGVLGGAGVGSGSVSVTGLLGKLSIGSVVAGAVGNGSGHISAGALGTAIVDQTLNGGVGDASGSITTVGNLTSIIVKNSLGATAALVAGKGLSSGAISVGGNLGTVTITGNLDGLRGGELDGHLVSNVAQVPGVGAASVQAGGSITKLTLTGALTGGPNESVGSITAGKTIGTLKVTGSLFGGANLNSGSIVAGGRIASATIQGTLQGGAGDNSGALISGVDTVQNGDLTKAVINGAITGGGGIGSGSVRAGGRIVSLTVGVVGGVSSNVLLQGSTGGSSGAIFGDLGIGLINILGSVAGGTGLNSGAIVASGAAATIKVAGSLTGAVGDGSGSIQVHDLDLVASVRAGDLATLIIGGAVTGSNGSGSGQILIEGTAKTLTLGALSGGVGASSGSISVGSGIAAMNNNFTTIGGAASITIKGALTGSTGPGSGTIDVGARLGALVINGAANNTAVTVGRDLGKLTIGAAVDHLLVSAQGQAHPTAKTDLTIGSITIHGAVSNSTLRAGYDRFGNPVNGGAQIGKVSITGDWTASNLVAGVQDVDQDGFGDLDDVSIPTMGGPISKIAGIIITGNVTGTGPSGDHFGFTAKQIVSVRIAGILQALTTGRDTIDLAGTPVTNDTAIRETA